jgi:hypothetical protein
MMTAPTFKPVKAGSEAVESSSTGSNSAIQQEETAGDAEHL